MTLRRIIPWSLAVVLGVALAGAALPEWLDSRARCALAADDPARRKAAWIRLTRDTPSDDLLAKVSDLRGAALLDAEDALQRCGAALRLSPEVRLRAAVARLERAAPWDAAAAWSSLRSLAGAPRSVRLSAAAPLQELAASLVTEADESAVLDLAAALAWPDAPTLLDNLALTTPPVTTRLLLLLEWVPDPGSAPTNAPASAPAPESVFPASPAASQDDAPPTWPPTLAILRRLLAWEQPVTTPVDPRVLTLPPLGTDGLDVILLALLAERAGRANELAPLWLRELNDRSKMAGTLLAVLAGRDQLPELEAVSVAHHPTELRHALTVAIAALSDGPATELAHRARRSGRDLDPLLLAILLASGDRSQLSGLTSSTPEPASEPAPTNAPTNATESSPGQRPANALARLLLIERFLPELAARLGRPPHFDPASTENEATLTHWFSRADSLRRLMFPLPHPPANFAAQRTPKIPALQIPDSKIPAPQSPDQ